MKLQTKLAILFLATSIIPMVFVATLALGLASIISIVVVFCVVIIALSVTKSITEPLIALTKIAEDISRGKLDVEIPGTTSRDEIGQLARAFHEMTIKLNKSYAVLEQKVSKLRRKTEEIESAKKALQEVFDDLKIKEEKLIEAKEKTESLAQDLIKYKLAVDNASDHITITDPDGITLYVNKASEKITGYTLADVIGEKAGNLWGNLMPKEFYDKLWQTIKIDKEVFIGELRNKRKNGQQYDASISIAPILDKKKNVLLFVGIERDITPEKNIDRAKTEFVSLASHQLRTPLTAINWYAEMILHGDVGKVIPEQKKYLEEIYHSNQRMIGLVNTLLDVSRIELGTFKIEPEPTDIILLARSVLDEQKREIERKKLMIVENFSEDVLVSLTDPKLFRMIFQNLISNAVEYTPERGKIEFVISADDKKTLYVEISDTGYGIPKNQQNQIFTKLFRADNVRNKDTDGTGLGLYIVKSIVENFGGKIWFSSPGVLSASGTDSVSDGELSQNSGTTFYVSLPIVSMKKKKDTKVIF